MKPALRVAFVLALTAVLLALWLRAFDPAALWEALGRSSPSLLLLAGLVNLLHVPARALRWRALLDGGGEPPPYRELVLTTAVGYLVSFVVPGRLGELVRPALLARRTGPPFGACLASVVFERLLDVATLVVLLGAFVLASPELVSPEWRQAAGLFALAAAAVLGLGIFVHRRFRSRLDRVVSGLARRLPGRLALGAERLGLTALRGFDSLLRPGAWWRLPALSALTWSTSLCAYALTLAASGATAVRTAPLLLTCASSIGIAIPTPAGIGGFEGILTWVLDSILGLPPARAAAVALLLHAVSVLPVFLLGLYYFLREGLSVRALSSAAAARSDAPGEVGP